MRSRLPRSWKLIFFPPFNIFVPPSGLSPSSRSRSLAPSRRCFQNLLRRCAILALPVLVRSINAARAYPGKRVPSHLGKWKCLEVGRGEFMAVARGMPSPLREDIGASRRWNARRASESVRSAEYLAENVKFARFYVRARSTRASFPATSVLLPHRSNSRRCGERSTEVKSSRCEEEGRGKEAGGKIA